MEYDDFDLQKHQLKTVLRNLEQCQSLLGWAQETYTEAMGAGDYWIGLCLKNVEKTVDGVADEIQQIMIEETK